MANSEAQGQSTNYYDELLKKLEEAKKIAKSKIFEEINSINDFNIDEIFVEVKGIRWRNHKFDDDGSVFDEGDVLVNMDVFIQGISDNDLTKIHGCLNEKFSCDDIKVERFVDHWNIHMPTIDYSFLFDKCGNLDWWV